MNKTLPRRLFQRLNEMFIESRSLNADTARREYLLNILLLSAIVAASIGLIGILCALTFEKPTGIDSITAILAFFILSSTLLALSRKGRSRWSAYTLICLFFSSGAYSLLRWSIDIPIGLLIFALTIVMGGILIGPSTAGVITAIEAVTLVTLGILQSNGNLTPNLLWRSEGIALADVIEFVVLLAIMALISWLSNHELEKSLSRTRASETALEQERNGLEIKVAERTKQIEQIQMERMLEVQRFAEFGRFSAGLMHDFANPLTVATLRAEELGQKQHSTSLVQIQASLQHLERYVEAARKQLQQQSLVREFDPTTEIRQVMTILDHSARTARVALEFRAGATRPLYGDAVKFNQLVANLLSNAIDAYQNSAAANRSTRRILVKLIHQTSGAKLIVHDWGHGISERDLPFIFQPFYTTKLQTGRGTGIGLALVKQIVEEDFNGEIVVTSSAESGTIFTVRLFDAGLHDAA